jgi:hypothetical protein
MHVRWDSSRIATLLKSNAGLLLRWIKTMDRKNTFQISAYLRFGLLTTHNLLVTLREPVEQAIDYYDRGTRVFALVSVPLKVREVDEELGDLFARTRSNHPNIKPLRLGSGHIPAIT